MSVEERIALCLAFTMATVTSSIIIAIAIISVSGTNNKAIR